MPRRADRSRRRSFYGDSEEERGESFDPDYFEEEGSQEEDAFASLTSGASRIGGETDGEGIEAALRELKRMIQRARSMPMSGSVLVTRDEALALVDKALSRLPDELERARWLLSEREAILARANREADEIVEHARSRAEHLVERSEIVRESRHAAQRIVERAQDQARRTKREVEEYCDQRLAAFEIVLERTLRTVHAGRERLVSMFEGTLPEMEAPESQGSSSTGQMPGEEFFDQDLGLDRDPTEGVQAAPGESRARPQFPDDVQPQEYGDEEVE